MDPDYDFTMSLDDQKRLIESGHGISYGELLKFIKERIESKKDTTISLENQSTSKFVLSIIEQSMMKATIEAFPTDLSLNCRQVYTFPEVHKLTGHEPHAVYDIRFMMPLIYHSVSPSQFVDCRDFIAKRCLALTIIGLASEDAQFRSLCYKTLERYYEHLLSALLIDKQLWINFLDLIRNSIPAANTRLRFIFATFLVRIIDILLHPADDKLYELMKEFLAGRPRLNINTIEIYDDLVMGSNVETYNENLRWIMTLFRDGLLCKNDLKVAIDLRLISQAMCLYNSALRFERANQTLMSIFIRIATIDSGASLLVNEYSFLPWVHHIIMFHLQQEEDQKNDPKAESLKDAVKSISSLIFTLVDVFLKFKRDDITLPRLLELVTVFISLHNLIIKSKDCSILEYYIDYVRTVVKAIRKDKKISDNLAGQLLELVKAKIPYLA